MHIPILPFPLTDRSYYWLHPRVLHASLERCLFASLWSICYVTVLRRRVQGPNKLFFPHPPQCQAPFYPSLGQPEFNHVRVEPPPHGGLPTAARPNSRGRLGLLPVFRQPKKSHPCYCLLGRHYPLYAEFELYCLCCHC
jgi:hypothetical protein